MRSRALAALLALPLLTLGLSGCTVAGDLQRLLDRAQGRPEFAEVERLNQEVRFAANETPAPPPAFGKVTVVNFTVGPSATHLRIDVTVIFQEAQTPAGQLPLPGAVPKGRVALLIATPERTLTAANFTDNAGQTYDVPAPAPGTWGIQLQTFGNGRVVLGAVATERVR